MARIAIGGLLHETNTFAPIPATLDRFLEADAWPELLRGDDLLTRPHSINLPIAGFIEAAVAAGHELVPLIWCSAGPSGRVTADAFETLVEWLLEALRDQGPTDGIYLDLHGAMVADHFDDGEGELLRRVRAVVGTATPIVASLDLHANVSPAMVELADALVAFRTYPHIDMAETGRRCLPLLERRIAGEPLAKACRRGDYLIPLPVQCSTLEPAASLFASLPGLDREGSGTISLVMGFPAADIACCGPCILGFGSDQLRTLAAVDALAADLAAAEPAFAGRLWSAEAAVSHAINAAGPGPVVLADTQDNPGGGGTGDTTGLLEALIGMRADAVLGLLIDPDAARIAHEAGEGASVRLALGGRHGPAGVRPIEASFDVVRLGSGRFVATGPFYGGNSMELGPMALLRVRSSPGVQVAVASRRVQAADQAMFRHLGVEPARERILALKSSVHFRADFEPLAAEILVVATPGFVPGDPATLPFEHLPETLHRRPRLGTSNAV